VIEAERGIERPALLAVGSDEAAACGLLDLWRNAIVFSGIRPSGSRDYSFVSAVIFRRFRSRLDSCFGGAGFIWGRIVV
jgi:hypothetical protein